MRFRLRGLPVFGFGVAGLLLGHAVSYLLAIPDPYHRDLALRDSGHGYLPELNEAAVILLLAGTATVGVRAWSRRRTDRPERFRPLVILLAAVQTGAFCGQEVLERLVAGRPLGSWWASVEGSSRIGSGGSPTSRPSGSG